MKHNRATSPLPFSAALQPSARRKGAENRAKYIPKLLEMKTLSKDSHFSQLISDDGNTRVLICRKFSLRHLAELSLKKRRPRHRPDFPAPGDHYLFVTPRNGEQQLIICDHALRHFATVSWTPRDREGMIAAALCKWSALLAAVPPAALHGIKSTRKSVLGSFKTLHCRLRPQCGPATTQDDNFPANFYYFSKFTLPVTFGSAMAQILHYVRRVFSFAAPLHFDIFDAVRDHKDIRDVEMPYSNVHDALLRTHGEDETWEIIKNLKECGAWIGCSFAGYAINMPLKTTCCSAHLDGGNNLLGLCGVMPYGKFTGAKLVLHDLKLCIGALHGDFTLFPSALLYHSNNHPTFSGSRGSIVFFTPVDLLRKYSRQSVLEDFPVLEQ